MARKTEKRNCLICKKEFDCLMIQINRGEGKFCSRKCAIRNRRTGIYVPCAFCQKETYVPPKRIRINKSGLYFCSRIHKNSAQRIEHDMKKIWSKHYKNGINAYRDSALRVYEHKCNRCGWNQYKEVLEVHHKDENRENNKIDNLEILCPNCHSIHHFLERRV